MYSLTIVLNLHREGKLVEKTIKNLQNIIQENQKTYKTWSKVEIVCILDNSDELTKSIVKKYKNIFNKVEHVNFKDIASSRNHGVDIANNNFILFADGDDYFSHNILKSNYDVFYNYYHNILKVNNIEDLKDNEHIAVFPKYLVEFPILKKVEYVDSNELIVQNIKFSNCYTSRISIYKELLKKYRAQVNTHPYGYEDWDLNNHLLANGVKFKISNYTLYYRKENMNSVFSIHVKNTSIVRNSLIYSKNKCYDDSKDLHKILINKKIKEKEKGKLRKTFARFKIFKKIYHYLKTKKQIKTNDIFKNNLNFLISYNEKPIRSIDNQYFTTKSFAEELLLETIAYNKLLTFFMNKDIIYIVPWIGLGGGDRVSVEYIKALENKNSCLVTTLSKGSRIDSIKVPSIDLSGDIDGWDNFSEENQLHIYMKAVINSNTKLVHIISSDFGLRTVKYYASVYNEYNVKMIVTLFCPDYNWDTKEYAGYPFLYPEIFNKSDLILSDNTYWYKLFKQINKNIDFNFKKIASVSEKSIITYKQKNINTKKILWASRICDQKLFHVFESIVKKLPEYRFVIYASKNIEGNNKQILDRLLKKNNIEFRGEYNNIKELDLNEFDIYLFTSMFEGIPTIILDMIMNGIPIVSANVGGISEALGENYPLLVNNPLDVDEYINKIKEFYNNKESIVSDILNIRNLVANTYNQENFYNDYNYIVKYILNNKKEKNVFINNNT